MNWIDQQSEHNRLEAEQWFYERKQEVQNTKIDRSESEGEAALHGR